MSLNLQLQLKTKRIVIVWNAFKHSFESIHYVLWMYACKIRIIKLCIQRMQNKAFWTQGLLFQFKTYKKCCSQLFQIFMFFLHSSVSSTSFIMSGSSHIQKVLIRVEYWNYCQTLDVHLLFAFWLGQIQSKLIYIFVTYELDSL